MSYEDDIINFLAKPDNLHVAFQVANYVQKLKEETHRKFWSAFSSTLQLRFESSQYIEKWNYQPFPMNKLRKGWDNCSLIPSFGTERKISIPIPSFSQGTSSDDFRLVMGIRWSNRGDFTHPLLIEMKQKLIQRNLTNESEWWLGWNWYKYRAQGEVLISKMHQDLDKTIDETVDDFWQFFLEFRPLIEDIIVDIPIKE